MRILSFDTSSGEIHVALLENAQVLQQRVIGDTEGNTRQEAVAMLMPAIVSLLGSADCAKEEIDCLVVGQGPGSFTGIRTAIVTARALAQALKLPLIAVPLFEPFAQSCQLPAAVILPAGRERYFACAFRAKGANDFQAWRPPFCAEAGQLALQLDDVPHWYCLGAVPEEWLEQGKTVEPLPIVENIATKQAQIAWNRLCLNDNQAQSPGGDKEDRRQILLEQFSYDAVTPLYLRNPSITLKKAMAIELRALNISDLDEVLEIEPVAFGSHHWSHQSFVNELSNSMGSYFAAIDSTDNRLLGYSGFWLIGEEAHITTLAVHPDFRRKYIGERLLVNDIVHAKVVGAHWITLEVRMSNESAQKLYYKYGFKSLGVRRNYYQDNDEDALVLWTENIQSPEFVALIHERAGFLKGLGIFSELEEAQSYPEVKVNGRPSQAQGEARARELKQQASLHVAHQGADEC